MATGIVLAFCGEAEMKCRESGMPAMTVWESFFDPEYIVTRLGCGSHQGNTVGLTFVREEALQCCSWHGGLVMRKPFP